MAWKPWAEELVGRLTAAGYNIQIVDVEAPQDVAAERIVSRWRQGFLTASAHPNNRGAQMGGRWVPRAAVDGLFTDLREHDGKPLHGKSVTEVNAREVSEESPRSPGTTCIAPRQSTGVPTTSNATNGPSEATYS